MIKLGNKVKDVVSGFTGIAVARYEYMNGCMRYCVFPRCGKGKTDQLPDKKVFDEEQLKVVSGGIKPRKIEVEADNGGSRPTPQARMFPARR